MGLRHVRELPIAAPLWRRLSVVHVNHKKIAASALLIGVLTVVAKLFVAGREIAIAWRYGVSGTVDAYQLALTIVTWLPMMLVSVMTVVFVPRLVALASRSSDGRRFVDELNGTVLIASVGLAAITWAAAPFAAPLFASNLQPATAHLTTTMCQMMSPVAAFFIWSGYLSARLQARERFAYTVTEAVPAVIIAACVFAPLVLRPEFRLGWATSAGYALQLVTLLYLIHRGDRPIGGFAFRHSAPEWSSLYRDLGVMALGQIIFGLALPIDQAFAARLGPGSVAAYGYATRLITLASALATVVFTRALLPVFATAVAQGDSARAARQARQWAYLLMGVGAVFVGLVWLFAEPVVALVFRRGAFSTADVRQVAHVLSFGVLQLPFVFAGMSLVQLMAAKGMYSALLWIACGALAVKLLLNAVLVHHFGLAGLMSATAAMYALSFACEYWVSVRK